MSLSNFQHPVHRLICESIDCICSRFERNAERGVIDTKFDIVSGEDFPSDAPAFRGKDFIYGWIQGRGLESLAGHARYFSETGDLFRKSRVEHVLRAVLSTMEKLRARNNGRIGFALSPEGKPLFKRTSDRANFSDLFYAKGLFAAACYEKNSSLEAEAERMFRFVLEDIDREQFHTDQHGFDPKNPVAFVPGKRTQGPRMIALSGLALFAEERPEQPFWLDRAEAFIDFILTFHVNQGQFKNLQPLDFVEAVDSAHRPWVEKDGAVLCDPGHALEFIGLAGKCLLQMRDPVRFKMISARCEALLPDLFCHLFDLGFQPGPGGIVKSYDLIRRRNVNSDMPWWSLPETVRAGAQLCALYPKESGRTVPRTAAALETFLSCYLRKNGFACQTRDASGRVAEAIPAVPDADPGYHTNLSLIDFLRIHPHIFGRTVQ
ncbi:MAG: hypothetical protein BWY31_04713 [Lentisphaerae bacterium ADurb.Bin242]|nr:MAG: hypothetical protein BWY31_04713 [Lentisphaerae bacterium ADurb.Bin242]